MADKIFGNPWGAPPDALALMAERDEIAADKLTRCRDCGIDAWGFEEDGQLVYEDFNVTDRLWDTVYPDDGVIRWTAPDGTVLGQGRFVICLGCFERRLDRQLTLRDFFDLDVYDALSDVERTGLAQEAPGFRLALHPPSDSLTVGKPSSGRPT